MPQAESTGSSSSGGPGAAQRDSWRSRGGLAVNGRPAKGISLLRKIFWIFQITSESDCNKIYTVLICDPD